MKQLSLSLGGKWGSPVVDARSSAETRTSRCTADRQPTGSVRSQVVTQRRKRESRHVLSDYRQRVTMGTTHGKRSTLHARNTRIARNKHGTMADSSISR